MGSLLKPAEAVPCTECPLIEDCDTMAPEQLPCTAWQEKYSWDVGTVLQLKGFTVTDKPNRDNITNQSNQERRHNGAINRAKIQQSSEMEG